MGTNGAQMLRAIARAKAGYGPLIGLASLSECQSAIVGPKFLGSALPNPSICTLTRTTSSGFWAWRSTVEGFRGFASQAREPADPKSLEIASQVLQVID